jgi:hypothetical protein
MKECNALLLAKLSDAKPLWAELYDRKDRKI